MTGMEIFLLVLVAMCTPIAYQAAFKPRKQNMYLFSGGLWIFCATMNMSSHSPATVAIATLQLVLAIGFVVGYFRSKSVQ